jgi:D-aminoacyl-tRNA deacylase
MRAVVQRVNEAQVRVAGEIVGSIERGLCVLACVMDGDTRDDALWLAKKVAALRIFSDEADKMNLSVKDVQGSVLAVSQFTLAGDVRKGSRPSFMAAMVPESAQELFCLFCDHVRALGIICETGRFQTHMEVSLRNDGPVTILLDSQRTF